MKKKRPLTPAERQLIESHNAMINNGQAGISLKPNKLAQKGYSDTPLFKRSYDEPKLF